MFFSINYRDYLQFLYAFFLTQSKQKANDMVALQVRSNQMSIRFFMKIVSTANGQNLLYQRKWLRARTAEKVHPQHTEAAACFPVTVRPWLLRFSAAWKLQSPQLISQFSGSVVSDSCNHMDCSTPGLPVHHQLPEFTQTHVHWVGDAIQPSHPLSSPSPPAFNLSQHQGLFKWVSSSHQVAKVLEFQHQSFEWIFRTDFL